MTHQQNPFFHTIINHPNLKRALQQLTHAVEHAQKGSVIFLYGPSGVGKTQLLRHFERKFTEKAHAAGKLKPGDIPVALVEAPAPNAGPFSWKEFYRRALISLYEPLPDKKLLPSRAVTQQTLDNVRTPGHELRIALENTIIHRQVEVFLIDEAHHFALRVSPKDIPAQLEYVKSLANLTETVLVLAGTYNLMAFRNLSGQLSRRSCDVHLPRYRVDIAEDYGHYVTLVATIESRLPLPCSPPLTEQIEELYVGSLGCIGLLKPWLDRAVKLVMTTSASSLTPKHLKETSLSYDQLKKLIDELNSGEEEFRKATKPLEGLRVFLGLPPAKGNKKAAPAECALDESKKGGPVGGRTPGIPNPVRLKIGKGNTK